MSKKITRSNKRKATVAAEDIPIRITNVFDDRVSTEHDRKIEREDEKSSAVVATVESSVSNNFFEIATDIYRICVKELENMQHARFEAEKAVDVAEKVVQLLKDSLGVVNHWDSERFTANFPQLHSIMPKMDEESLQKKLTEETLKLEKAEAKLLRAEEKVTQAEAKLQTTRENVKKARIDAMQSEENLRVAESTSGRCNITELVHLDDVLLSAIVNSFVLRSYDTYIFLL